LWFAAFLLGLVFIASRAAYDFAAHVAGYGSNGLAAQAHTSTHVRGMARTCLRVQHILGWICAFSPDDFLFSSANG
jgi:hypothetical protein